MRNEKAAVLMYACELAPISEDGLDKDDAFVEIGCIREDHEVPTDGYSTVYLARYCGDERSFWSVDTNPDNITKAKSALKNEDLLESINAFHIGDGAEFLRNWNVEQQGRIALLYLDSHRDPQYSLDQFIAAQGKLASSAIVAIDDAHEYDGHAYGKATYLIKLFDRMHIKYKILPTEPGFKMVVARFHEVY